METVKWWSYSALIGNHREHQGNQGDSPTSLGWVIVHNHKLGRFHGVWSLSMKLRLWLCVGTWCRKKPYAAFLFIMYKHIHPRNWNFCHKYTSSLLLSAGAQAFKRVLAPCPKSHQANAFSCIESSYVRANTKLCERSLLLSPKMVLPKPLVNTVWRMCGESLVKTGTKTHLHFTAVSLAQPPPCAKTNYKHYLNQLLNTHYWNIAPLMGARNKTPFDVAEPGDPKLLELCWWWKLIPVSTLLPELPRT